MYADYIPGSSGLILGVVTIVIPQNSTAAQGWIKVMINWKIEIRCKQRTYIREAEAKLTTPNPFTQKISASRKSLSEYAILPPTERSTGSIMINSSGKTSI